MEVVAAYDQTQEYEDEKSLVAWSAGYLYQLLKCPACKLVSLRRAWYHDGAMDPCDIVFELLFPQPDQSAPAGLPRAIHQGYEAATRVRGIDPNAYGVLLRRVLELVCEDRQAQGRNLNDKLQDLADRDEIPDKLVAVAGGLRQLGNIGAHPGLGELTESESPIINDLCKAILDYVYTAPFLADRAEESLEKLQRKKRKKKASDGGG
jgi:hypothetical protein